MAENAFQEIEQTNLDLLMNAASWLRNRPDTLGIPPHTHVALTLSVDPFLRSRLILVPSAVAVMLIIAHGDHRLHGPTSITNDENQPLDLDLGWHFLRDPPRLLGARARRRLDRKRAAAARNADPARTDRRPGSQRAEARRSNGATSAWSSSAAGKESVAGRWSSPMTWRPSRTGLETLVRNLKELRKSLDSGSIAGSAGIVWPGSAGRDGQALGGIDRGRTNRRRADRDPRCRQDRAYVRYVRPGGYRRHRDRRQQIVDRGRLALDRLARARRDGRADLSGRVGDHQATRPGHSRRRGRRGNGG